MSLLDEEKRLKKELVNIKKQIKEENEAELVEKALSMIDILKSEKYDNKQIAKIVFYMNDKREKNKRNK